MLHATALLAAMLATGGPAEASCTEPSQLAWAVMAAHGVVAEDASVPLAAIQEAARRRGRVPAHPPLGFYLGHFAHDIAIRTQGRATGADGSECGRLTTVLVRLALVDRTVEVARDLKSDPCLYAMALTHYRKHAAADDATLSTYLRIVREALAEAWPGVEGDLEASGHMADEAAIRRTVEPVVDRALEGVDQVRVEASKAVDSAEEVKHLAAACPRS